MSSRIEPNDGRIITKVRIKSPSLIPNQKGLDRTLELVADTGGITIIPYQDIAPWIGHTSIVEGPVQHTNFGTVVQLSGLIMEVEVEEHGGGNPEIRQCDEIHAHFLPLGSFLSVDGLLGMDQFDRLKADPVKNAAGDRAYLAKRK